MFVGFPGILVSQYWQNKLLPTLNEFTMLYMFDGIALPVHVTVGVPEAI
jgi:hypothetical protein